jgi:phosphate uptake regulator
MRRKVVQQGAATLMISLPSKWAKEKGLKKGDEIDLEESGSNLIVMPEAVKAKSEVEINLIGLVESSIRTLISNTYRMGYDRIKVNFSSNEQFKLLQETIKTRLLGFDIIKKEKNSCIIENITEPSPDQFENIFQKIFLNSVALIDITEQRMLGKKPDENYEDIESRIQQYENFCKRVLAKSYKKENLLFWTFLTLIIHGQREIYHLNRFLDKNKGKESANVIELLHDAKKMAEMIQEAYAKKDVLIIEKMHELEKTLIYQKAYKIMKDVAVYHITSCIRNLYLAGSPLIGLLLA